MTDSVRNCDRRIGPAKGLGPWLLTVLLCGSGGGCAALTNPVVDGIPVRHLPAELLAPTHEGEEDLPLNLLRQPVPPAYLLASGDVLGVWIEGVLGDRNQQPPVYVPQISGARLPEREDPVPYVGYPTPVGEDGMVALPLVPPIRVQGLTLERARAAIRRAYTEEHKILEPGHERIVINLMRPRMTQVMVFRHDPPGAVNTSFLVTSVGPFGSGTEFVGNGITGSGHIVDLPGYDNDVLHALARTGGVPGTNASGDILVFRGYFQPGTAVPGAQQRIASIRPGCRAVSQDGLPCPVVRIALRLRPGEVALFQPEDVVLQPGDAVFVENREAELFYSGGLMPPGEHIMPQDYDLHVVEAVLRVKGPLVNGAFAQSNLNGTIVQPGIGNPNPSLLTVIRRTPEGGTVPIRVDLNIALRDARENIVVQRGDVLILQETPGEALARYFTQKFDFTVVWRVFQTSRATGTITASTP